jgi:hypothetical protein
MQDAVVGARDELALRAADDPRTARQPRADRHVAVAGQERRDERQQRAQVRRQVDVHIADDLGVAARPGRAQGATAALFGEAQEPDAGQVVGQRGGDLRGCVGARVVGDDDAPRERQLGRQVVVQPADRGGEDALLVEDRHDDLDAGRVRHGNGGEARLGEEVGEGHGARVGAVSRRTVRRGWEIPGLTSTQEVLRFLPGTTHPAGR